METQRCIEEKIKKALHPEVLEVVDETAGHNVPRGSESHFKLVVVASVFSGKSLVERHRMVNAVLVEELKERIHALTMQTLTPEEWEHKSKQILKSPPCLGGSR